MTRNVAPSEMGFELRIAPDLEPLAHPLGDFTPHPRNIRKHDLGAITHSLREYGQQTPITVQRSSMYICKGNGTWAAAKALGATRIAASVEDLDDARAFRYLLDDNRTSDKAGYDVQRAIDTLQSLIDGPGLDGTLWTADDVDDLVTQLGGLELDDEELEAEYMDLPEGYVKRKEARDERLGAGGKLKEVPLLLRPETHEQLMKDVALVRKTLGIKGNIDAIVAAVRLCARSLELSPENGERMWRSMNGLLTRCSICDFEPMADDSGLVVRHSPQCPKASEDPLPASEQGEPAEDLRERLS